MTTNNMCSLELNFIIPVTQKIVPLHLIYNNTLIEEYVLMPWETGISKKIHAHLNIDPLAFDIDLLKISGNDINAIIEIVKVNQTVQSLINVQNNKFKMIYLNQFINEDSAAGTIIKISNLSDKVRLSHSYLCNGHLYVPECDRNKSVLSFDSHALKTLNFEVSIYKTDMTNCLFNAQCEYSNNNISIVPKLANLAQSHPSLNNNKISEKHESLNQETFNEAHIAYTTDNSDKNFFDTDKYSVIKIEGLPNNLIEEQKQIFFHNNAYYLSFEDKPLFEKMLRNIPNDILVTVSYYMHNTVEPIKQSTFATDLKTNVLKKIA